MIKEISKNFEVMRARHKELDYISLFVAFEFYGVLILYRFM